MPNTTFTVATPQPQANRLQNTAITPRRRMVSKTVIRR